MAMTLSYDPSTDPEAIAAAEERDAELLSIGQEMEDQQNELLAGKFNSAEDLEKAYIELQKTLGSRKNDSDEESVEEEEVTEEDESEQYSLTDTLMAEIYQYGQLSQETADAIGEDVALVIERLAANQQESVALNDEQTEQIQGIVGGAEAYNEMIEWSASNLIEGEQDAYNAVMNSGDLNAIYWAVTGLKSRYQDSVGVEGELIRGKAAPTSGNIFRSMAELVRAQSDPRYDKDPAFRYDVESKLARSGDLY
jgi:hypothetical protein